MVDESWRDALHQDLVAGKRRPKRISPYDTRGWKTRRSALKHDARCVLCARFKIHVAASVADHIIPSADSTFGGELQPLCGDRCHRLKRRVEGRWRRGELGVAELNFATGKEALRLRAAAFGVGVDGYPLVRVE